MRGPQQSTYSGAGSSRSASRMMTPLPDDGRTALFWQIHQPDHLENLAVTAQHGVVAVPVAEMRRNHAPDAELRGQQRVNQRERLPHSRNPCQ